MTIPEAKGMNTSTYLAHNYQLNVNTPGKGTIREDHGPSPLNEVAKFLQAGGRMEATLRAGSISQRW